MPIVFGIDGTGPGDGDFLGGSDAANAKDFVKSFVSILCKKPSQDSLYARGPLTHGAGLEAAVERGYKFIWDRYNAPSNNSTFAAGKFGLPSSNKTVLLTGYSRGGAGVIALAEKLKARKIEVGAMLLFDAVDRHATINAGYIPENVKQVLHVKRDPKSKSRWTFGNCGENWNRGTTMVTQKEFMCTHRGMGGTPWTCPKGGDMWKDLVSEVPDGGTAITYYQDAVVSAQVWQYVLPFAKNFGFLK